MPLTRCLMAYFECYRVIVSALDEPIILLSETLFETELFSDFYHGDIAGPGLDEERLVAIPS